MADVSSRNVWAPLLAAADIEAGLQIGCAFALTLAVAMVSAASPLALKALIDGLSGGNPIRETAPLAAAYVGLLGAVRLAAHVQVYLLARGEQKLQSRLGASGFAHLLRLPLSFHLNRQGGAVAHTQLMALQGVRLLLANAGFVLAPAALQIVLVMAIVAGVLGGPSLMVLCVSAASYLAVFVWSARRLDRPTRDALDQEIAASGFFSDGVTNIENVKSAAAEPWLGERYLALLVEGRRRWNLCHARRLEASVALAVIFAACLWLSLRLGISGVSSGETTIGSFVMLNAYVLQLMQPIENAGLAARDLSLGKAYVAAWVEVMNHEAEGQRSSYRPAGAESAAIRSPPAIRFENISFAYRPDRPALRNVTFSVAQGGSLAIVGPSGAGKSSLVRLLLRHMPPSHGRILIDEAPADAMALEALRQSIAIVTQDIVLFNDTLRQNLLVARPGANDAALRQALTDARLGDLLSRLPEGLESRVGERGLALSGGERQRVALARAFLRKAPVLVLDEATSGLDADNERALIAHALDRAPRPTTLLITHRTAVATEADTIVVLVGGEVAEAGSHAELLAADGYYARLWRRQTAEASP